MLLIGAMAAIGAEPGPVAHYRCDAGTGDRLRDHSGRDHHATIHGAEWVTGEFGAALQFDSVDDYVECAADPALSTEEAGSVLLWFRPEAHQGGLVTRSTGGGWPDERLVLAFNTYGGEPHLQWALADGEKYQCRPLDLPPLGEWCHLALAFDGQRIRVFRDGALVASIHQTVKPRVADVPLVIGRCEGLGKQFFQGLIDEVEVYGRALSEIEVLARYKAEAKRRGKDVSGFDRPKLEVAAYADSGRLLVSADYAAMRPVPEGAVLEIEIARDGAGEPLRRERAAMANDRGPAEIILDLQEEPPGGLTVAAQARDAEGGRLGQQVTQDVQWPEREAGVKVLNNMVFELLNVAAPGEREHTIDNPREGWVFISLGGLQTAGVGGVAPAVRVDDQAVALRPVGQQFEAMAYLSEGPHRVSVAPGLKPDRLIVRAVGELFYSMYGANPLVPETGDYTWEFLREHVLDHYNTIIGRGTEDQDPRVREWVGEGKRWMSQRNLPWVDTVGEAYEFWAQEPGMQRPLMHGIWADEFGGGERYRKMYPIWCEALRRLKADPKLAGRQFYAYTGSTFTPDIEPLVKTVQECGYRLAPEWYLREQSSEADVMPHFGPKWERGNRANWAAAHPDAPNNRVLILGLLSQPEESCDIYPHCDYNVYLDLQFQFLATQPAYFGLRGLQGYYSPYVGEEQTRLFARLVRHYAIEGHTERMLPDPYELTHLQNPDFLAGTEAWELSPAADGSITPITAKHFGWLQGRYIRDGVGDSVLWTKRSAAKPNAIAQTISNLQPGRLYSLRLFTGNHQDLLAGTSRGYEHAVSIDIANAELIPQKTFQAIIKSCYAHTTELFNRDNPYRLNYHQRVFRPKAETARLTLSDWASEREPGGPTDEELIWNFVQVQPYFPE